MKRVLPYSMAGARVWLVSEYGHCDVTTPVYLNRVLRQAGWLTVRQGPFGEQLDTFGSDAFAVCDHQLAHVYVKRAPLIPAVVEKLQATPGVAGVYTGEARAELGLLHPRSGEIIVLAEPSAWLAYPFWMDDRLAPDYARCIDIHRKPGFDPCELFFDPKLLWPMGHAIRRLVQKKLGFRTLFDVIPLDAGIVRGSHGLRASETHDRPILVGDGPTPSDDLAMTDVRDLLLAALR
jgi:Type I phosphodiesterase / nucleotide pyrophosphatase